MKLFFNISILVFLFFLPFNVYFERKFDKILKEIHPEVWDEIEMGGGYQTVKKGWKFLWKSEYIKLNNNKLNKVASCNKVFSIIYATSFIATITLMLISFIGEI